MKFFKYLFFTILLSIVIFSAGLHAQDSTSITNPQKLYLNDGTVLTGTIVSRDSLSVQIQSKDGKLIKVNKSSIKRSELAADGYRKIPVNQNLKLDIRDGSSVIGKIISVTDSTLVFKTLSGIDMTVPILAVDNYEVLGGEVVDDVYYRKDPNQSRLFVAPTAQPIGNGKFYFSDYMVFFPSFAVGLGDVISFGAGVTLIPGLQDQLYYLNLKITFINATFSENNLCFAAGGMYGNVTASNNAGGGGLIYGLATYSRSIFGFTFGIFEPVSGNSSGNPVLLFGGEARLSNSVKIITENYLSTSDNTGIYSLGVRFFGEKLSADFGLFTTASLFTEEGFPFIPWVGFGYNF